MFSSGVRASSLSPLDSSQKAYQFAQNLSLRVNIEPRKHCFVDAYLLVRNTLVMYTCACALVGPP
eukprot:8847890-Heterocapsa_arctica.AAC.1